MKRKILFQIAREEDEKMSFSTNELTALELRALICEMENILYSFKEEVKLDYGEEEELP